MSKEELFSIKEDQEFLDTQYEGRKGWISSVTSCVEYCGADLEPKKKSRLR